jgi:hypothetical protein
MAPFVSKVFRSLNQAAKSGGQFCECAHGRLQAKPFLATWPPLGRSTVSQKGHFADAHPEFREYTLLASNHSMQPETDMAITRKEPNRTREKSRRMSIRLLKTLSPPATRQPGTGGTTRIESEDGAETDEDSPE